LITVDHCPEIVVENGNSEDINLYVATELFPTDQTEMHQEIRQEVVQKANGVFLWVVLVIQILSEESDSGEASNVKWMQRRLHSVPGQLEELFQDLFKKIKPSDLQATVFLIQMVLFAIRPVNVNEMCQCLGLKVEGYKSLKDWEQCMTYTNDMETFKRRIRSLSRGLIDVTAAGMTQFIHQSVVDFFLNHNGLFLLDSTLESNAIGKSHCSIIAVSLQCLAIEEINLFSDIDTPEVERILGHKRAADRSVLKRAQMSKRYNYIWDASELFPFLWYVTKCLLKHFSAAERANVTPTSALQQFLQSENLLWQRFKDSTILCHWNILTKPLYPHKVLYSFVMQGLEDCVRALISMGVNVNEESELGSSQFPLHAAASINDQKLLETLIEAGATIGIKDRSGRTVLHLFAMQNNESAIQKIISCGLDVNTVDRNKQTALHHSVRNSIPEVRLVEPTTYRRENVLSFMSQSSHSRLSILLIENGADVDSRDADKRTPLHWAVMRSDVAHVALLLEHKADPNIEDLNGEAPLHMAVQRRHSGIVSLLVDYGADVNACDSDDMTPSQLAIEARDIEMVRLLDMKGAAGASELIKLFEERGDYFLLNGSGQPVPIIEEPNPFAKVYEVEDDIIG
jgi:ankyrin repeat protein